MFLLRPCVSFGGRVLFCGSRRRWELGAFEEVYRTHAGKLFSLVLRMVGNPSDAEDLLQDIFLSAHRKLDSFRGESALGTWLYRLATNQCLDHLRGANKS